MVSPLSTSLPPSPSRAEPERLVGEQFVHREAVVQFDDVDVLWADLGLVVYLSRRMPGHVGTDDGDRALVGEGGLEVGHHGLPDDLDRLRGQPVLLDECLAGHDHGARAVRGRRALQSGEFGRRVDHLGGLDLVERVLVLELRVRVVHRMPMVLLADLGEVLGGGAVALHVFDTGRAEHPRRRRERELEAAPPRPGCGDPAAVRGPDS